MSDYCQNCGWNKTGTETKCVECGHIFSSLSPANGSAFDEWWNRVGVFYDPDTSDVPWEDKRRFLAELAFDAAMAQSRNYTADRAVDPLNVTFANGSTVSKGSIGLMIGTQNDGLQR